MENSAHCFIFSVLNALYTYTCSPLPKQEQSDTSVEKKEIKGMVNHLMPPSFWQALKMNIVKESRWRPQIWRSEQNKAEQRDNTDLLEMILQ